MDIQPLIKHTVLDNAVALPGSHRASAQAVPSALDVTLDPFLDSLDVASAVLQLFADLLAVRVQQVDLWLRLSWGKWHGPAAVANVGRQVAGQSIGVGGGQVHVSGASRRVIVKEWVLYEMLVLFAGIYGRIVQKPYHRLDLTSICIHAASRLA